MMAARPGSGSAGELDGADRRGPHVSGRGERM
jgi:hypothetical protein